jgi:phytoene dehydrogenase-like protein
MPVAELLNDEFESDALKGAVGAAGVTGIFQGPRASGTAYMLLHHLADTGGELRANRTAHGGIGGLAGALAAAARAHGAEIRCNASVAQVIVKNGRATGVALESGEEIAARQVASNADPARTFLGLVGAEHLEPEFVRDVGNIRYRGAVGKVNLALGELPHFPGLNGDAASALRGTITISPSLDYLERAYDDAKYGEPSARPYMEAVIPTLADPGLAPPGKHVLSILVQYAPYQLKSGSWAARREQFGDAVVQALADYAPNLPGAVLGRQVLTPADLEATFGLTGGSLYHGELTLDQLFFMRPVAGWAQYRTPVDGLYLCGAGAHPGGGLSGLPGRNAAREMLKETRNA